MPAITLGVVKSTVYKTRFGELVFAYKRLARHACFMKLGFWGSRQKKETLSTCSSEYIKIYVYSSFWRLSVSPSITVSPHPTIKNISIVKDIGHCN